MYNLTVLILGVVLFLPALGILPGKVLGAESCCEHSCSCPTPTPICPSSQPTPTTVKPTPTIIEPSPTSEPQPTPTGEIQPTFTLTPTPVPSGSGDGGGIGGPGDGGPASPPVCTDAVPPKPYLRDLKLLGKGKVSLLWDFVDPATHYSISYGPSSGKYLYGVDNTGKTNSFIIGELGTGNYCFVVKGVNNCMPGEFSNERCTGQAGKVLGAAVLGATGSFDSNLFNIAFIMGTICSSIGIRLLFGSRRLV